MVLDLIRQKHKELDFFEFYEWVKLNDWELTMAEEQAIIEAYNHGAVQGYEYANSSTDKKIKSGVDYLAEKYER
jgi:hypothetical protein